MSDRTDKLDQDTLRKLEETAQGIAGIIGPVFDAAGAKFAMLGFTTGPGGWSTYVCNANRSDMIKALREMADVLESKSEQAPLSGGPALSKEN